MDITASPIIKRYIAFSQWFIPEKIRQNPLQFTRAQNVISAATIAGISDPLYAFLYKLLGFGSATYVILLCGAFMVSAPFVLRTSGNIKAAEEVFVCAVFFNFCWLTYHLGGVDAPTAPWLIICPVVAMLLGGVVTGIFWLAVSCIAVIGIYLLQVNGFPLPPSPIQDALLLHTMCGVGLFIVVVFFVLFFELTKTQGFVKLERALQIIQELAIRDELTGTHNRRHLIKLIEEEKERAHRSGGAFCVCLLDIDYFKRINDTYGHSAGDKVLKVVASTVQGNIRKTDSFGRYGGEEFLLMLPQTALDDAFDLAEKVRGSIEKIDFPDLSSSLTITVSIGIAQFQPGENIAQTISRADQALYRAKSGGRNRVICDGSSDAEDNQNRSAHISDELFEELLAASEAIGPSNPDKQRQKPTASENNDVSLVDIDFLHHPAKPQTGQWSQADSAQYDVLTGLPNRLIFRDRLTHAMHRAIRNHQMLALMVLDINKFKDLNDALGYEKGDRALIQVAERIKGCLRDSDTVSRWDGDEFIVILENVLEENAPCVVAQKIVDEFTKPLFLDETECFLSLSIGITVLPIGDNNIDGLLRKADIAMLQAKSSGQNNYQIYSQDMDPVAIERLVLKNQLRHALYRDQLFLQYQPQVEINTKEIIGVEALIRWQHPELGFITPEQFIPLAEETGLIIPIGEWVLRTACAQNKAWLDAGLPPIKIAVNLSIRQLTHPGLIESIQTIISETGIDPAYLDLELTEGLLIEDPYFSEQIISKLRAMGIKISIDDFGTGYSSLSYLSELPFDFLKMDGLFVKRLEEAVNPENSYFIAEAIISMAHNLDLKVIAEAVETEQQLMALRKMNCDQMQGFYFSHPVPNHEIEKMLREQKTMCKDSGPLKQALLI